MCYLGNMFYQYDKLDIVLIIHQNNVIKPNTHFNDNHTGVI